MKELPLVRLLQRTIMYVLVVMAIVGVSMSAVAAQPPRGGTRPMVAYEFTSISAGIQHTCALTSVGTIYCWGDNANGQLGIGSLVSKSVPTLVKQPTGVIFRTVSASGNHTCALSTTNKAYCWGNNLSGQLGNSTTTNSTVPVAVSTPVGVTFTHIQIGWAHTCALTNTNVAYCWGNNDYGNVGNDLPALRFTTPMRVSMPTSIAFSTITIGQYHSCAMTTTANKAYCWGFNVDGRIGDGSTTRRNTPVAVTLPASMISEGGVSGLSAGGQFSCAITSGKTAYCWGLNDKGQIGDASSSNRLTPVQVSDGSGTPFASLDTISAGGKHACGLAASTPYCWGQNNAGQLGKGTLVNSNVAGAVTIPSGVTFTSISAGGEHTCALTATNEAYCWGLNNKGQLGDGTTTNRTTPVLVVMPQQPTSTPTKTMTNSRTATPTRTNTRTATVTRTATGTRTATSTRTNTRTFTPSNTATASRTGTATRTPTITFTASRTLSPTQTRTSTITFTASRTLSPTQTRTFTVTFTPSRTLTPSLTHTPTITPTPAVIYYGRISAGNTGDSTCALQTTTGKVYCWGDHYYGGSVSNPEKVKIPRLVGTPAGVTFTKMVRASSHACAIATNGNTYCWGNNDQGQLGDGTLVHKTIANLVSMPTNPSTGAVIPFTSLSASQNATCALDSSGQAYCWGINTVGTLGDNTGVNSTTPVRVQMPAGVTFASLSENGSGHICALDSSGNAYCWGLNNKGQLGDGTNTNRLMPVPVSMPAGVAFSQITVGMFHTCAMTTGTLNKRIYCWGYNNVGQLGIGLAEDSPVPVLVTNPATNLFGVYAGGMHTCAIFQSGTYCWGLNTSGQLGDGTTTNSFTPVAVTMPGTAFFGHMSLGYAHSCAVTNSSIAYCWGRNTIGAVGDNTYTNRSIPVEVVQPDGTLPITPTPGGGGGV